MSFLRFDAVEKRYAGIHALRAVSFSVGVGACHALCGENGAGKSTLGKILAGVVPADSGRIWLTPRDGGEPQALRLLSPKDARAAGIGIVHQELAFCENLTVAENLALGDLPRRAGLRGTFGEVDQQALAALARERLGRVGIRLDPQRRVGSLSLAEQQQVQIAAALAEGARVVVFDEPTSSLTRHEAEALFALLGRLKTEGVTCLYVSHRMEEIFRLCDHLTVLRDGQHVHTGSVAELNHARLVSLMVGRTIAARAAQAPREPAVDEASCALSVKAWSAPPAFREISFELRRGEVVGVAGLVGAGRTELAESLYGLRAAQGTMKLGDRAVHPRTPREAMALGVALVPEDRKKQGLVMGLGARENFALPWLGRFSRGTMIRRGHERTRARKAFAALGVKAAHEDVVVAGLSGGNQQKVVLAKGLEARGSVLILDEPTRGVDVGAKEEIHTLIEAEAALGMAVLLISSDLPELLALSTRILVMRGGRLVGEVARAAFSEEGVLALMTGAPGAAT